MRQVTQGWTPLFIAAHNGYHLCVTALLSDARTNVNQSANTYVSTLGLERSVLDTPTPEKMLLIVVVAPFTDHIGHN